MKFQTLFATGLGPLAAIFATATARDTNDGTAISSNNGTSNFYNNSTSTLYSNVTSTSINDGTEISTNNGTALSTNNGITNLHCDANCAHRLIFHSGYNSARDGYRMVLDAYDGYDWCFSDAKDWCPDVINLTTTRIASQVKTDVTAGIDYNNINNLTLLSTVLTVNARSRRTAISLAQSLMESSPLTCPEDRTTDLEKVRWLMAQQEGPIDYDANKFDEYVADQNGEVLEKRSWNACKGDPFLCSNLPFLHRLVLGARKLLSKLKYKMLRSAIDQPVSLNEIEQMGTEWELWKWRARNGPKGTENWLDEVADPFEPVPKDFLAKDVAPEPFEPPDFPLDFGKGVPADRIPPGSPFRRPPPGPPDPEGYTPPVPDSVGPPVEPPPPVELPVEPPPLAEPLVPPSPPVAQVAEPIGLFRAEMFDPMTGTLRQVTVKPGFLTEKQALIMEELKEVGVRPYEVLDSAGKSMQTTWLKPSDFVQTQGRWAERGEQFVREQFNNVAGRMEPVLNSLGEPLVASAEGTLMTLAPVALRPAEAGAVAVLEGAAAGISNAAGAFFDLFKPEGGRPRKSRVIFNQMDGSVDIRDPSAPPEAAPEDTGDQQNNDELDENESDHPKTNELKEHEAPDKDDHENSEDKENDPEEIEATQTAETMAPDTTAAEPTTAEPTTATTTPNTDTLDFATPNSYLPTTVWPTNAPPTPDAEHTQTTGAPKQTSVPHGIQQGKPSDGPTPSLPTVVQSPIPSTKLTTSKTKSEKFVSSTKSVTSVPSTTSSLNLKSDYLVPHTRLPVPTIVHKTTQEPETQHHATSNPYPYPNSHLPMTFPAPTMTHDATEAMKTYSSNVYPYPDNHPLPTSKKEMDDEATSNVFPFPNSHIPKTFPAPTKAHDATEAMKTHTSNIYPYQDNYHHTPPALEKTCTHDGIYPYPDNYCPHTAKKETHTQTTSNIYPCPNNHASPTPTTFATVTKSHESKTSTSISAMPAVPTLTGCQTNSDCPVCSFDTGCQIGDLPPECVRNAVNIDNVAISGNYTWDDCVDEIWKLDRAEAKAWAVAITSPVCLTGSEWEPKYMDRGHVSECWLDVRGDEFAKVRDIWITGLLPLKCPSDRDIKDGGWHGYGEDLKDDCKKAADVLSRPFNDD